MRGGKMNGIFNLKGVSAFLKSDRTVKILIFAGLAVIMFIFLWDFSDRGKKDAAAETTDISVYQQQLEEKLASILSRIDGTGEINVMITMESTEENVLSEKETVKSVISPRVRGVIVICDGGGNVVVKQKIVDAVTKVFDISSTKVSVTN